MELHQIRYFFAVCDALNFTRAAERCHVSQPALTKALKKMVQGLPQGVSQDANEDVGLHPVGQLVPHRA